MTTIAYDGNMIAADTQCNSGFIEQQPVNKIHDCGECYLLTAGSTGAIKLWIEWYKEGCDKDEFKKIGFEENSVYVIEVNKKTRKARTWDSEFPVPTLDWSRAKTAEGSGRDFAMGAMLAGKGAGDAVVIASKLDKDTGGKIRTVVL
jgi:hypothetical protein